MSKKRYKNTLKISQNNTGNKAVNSETYVKSTGGKVSELKTGKRRRQSEDTQQGSKHRWNQWKPENPKRRRTTTRGSETQNKTWEKHPETASKAYFSFIPWNRGDTIQHIITQYIIQCVIRQVMMYMKCHFICVTLKMFTFWMKLSWDLLLD